MQKTDIWFDLFYCSACNSRRRAALFSPPPFSPVLIYRGSDDGFSISSCRCFLPSPPPWSFRRRKPRKGFRRDEKLHVIKIGSRWRVLSCEMPLNAGFIAAGERTMPPQVGRCAVFRNLYREGAQRVFTAAFRARGTDRLSGTHLGDVHYLRRITLSRSNTRGFDLLGWSLTRERPRKCTLIYDVWYSHVRERNFSFRERRRCYT